MATRTFNPYPIIGTQLTDGMEAISKSLKATSTVDDLADAIYKYIQPIYYPAPVSTQVQIEIKSVVYNVINAYNNQILQGYDDEQMIIIGMMLGPTTTDKTPINSLDMWFENIEDNISEAGLSLEDQMPLLLAIEVEKTIYNYWITKVATPGNWSKFFQPQTGLNYANIPFWVEACTEGALIGGNASDKGLIAPTTDIVSVDIVSALIGALAIGAGKVIFKWVPRIQPIQLSMETPDGLVIGGYSLAMQGGNIQALGTKTNKKDCIVVNNCDGGNCNYGCNRL
ncbi:MAG: hypothetical protein HYX39_14300 [Bacteroidetes bacterium]|nr:hypothetical protein [Bacteroidota bacterium]